MPMSDKNMLKTTNSNPTQKTVLTEGVDFYIENGLYVFSEDYLKERGYCCGNGCRHCPYDKNILPIITKKQPDKSN